MPSPDFADNLNIFVEVDRTDFVVQKIHVEFHKGNDLMLLDIRKRFLYMGKSIQYWH